MLLILLLTSQINSANDPDYASNLYRDRRKCFYSDEDNCTSTELKRVDDLNCCRFEMDDVDDIRYLDFQTHTRYEDYVECKTYFTSYVSETMEKQYQAFIYESVVFLRAFLGIYIPRMRETINCSFGSMSNEYGGEDYIKEEDFEKIRNSKNSCLYYYRFSMRGFIEDNRQLIINQELCENAEMLEQTRRANVTCNYMEIDVQFEDGTKDKIKSCYLFPSEALKTGILNPNIEDAIRDVAETVAEEKKKNYTEFDVNIFVKDGKTIIYNSEVGIVIPDEESNSGYFMNIIYQIIFFGLVLLF